MKQTDCSCGGCGSAKGLQAVLGGAGFKAENDTDIIAGTLTEQRANHGPEHIRLSQLDGEFGAIQCEGRTPIFGQM